MNTTDANAPKLLAGGAEPGREKPLRDWLERNEATLVWTRSRGTYAPQMECWLVRQVPVIVCLYRDGRGWELFVPSAPHQNRVESALDHAAILIGHGCQGCRGLAPGPADARKE